MPAQTGAVAIGSSSGDRSPGRSPAKRSRGGRSMRNVPIRQRTELLLAFNTGLPVAGPTGLVELQPGIGDELLPAPEVGLDQRGELLGGPGMSSAPSFSSRSLTSGRARIRSVSRLSLTTMSCGVPAGATMPQ